MPRPSKPENAISLERTINMRAGLGSTARIVQRAELTSHRITADAPILIRVKRGCKLIRWNGGQIFAEEGDAVALASGGVFDITNSLSNEGEYEGVLGRLGRHSHFRLCGESGDKANRASTSVSANGAGVLRQLRRGHLMSSRYGVLPRLDSASQN